MAFSDKVRDLGNHIAFAENNQGTARRGIPSAIAEIGRTETAPPVADPKTLKRTGAAGTGLSGFKKRALKVKR